MMWIHSRSDVSHDAHLLRGTNRVHQVTLLLADAVLCGDAAPALQHSANYRRVNEFLHLFD